MALRQFLELCLFWRITNSQPQMADEQRLLFGSACRRCGRAAQLGNCGRRRCPIFVPPAAQAEPTLYVPTASADPIIIDAPWHPAAEASFAEPSDCPLRPPRAPMSPPARRSRWREFGAWLAG